MNRTHAILALVSGAAVALAVVLVFRIGAEPAETRVPAGDATHAARAGGRWEGAHPRARRPGAGAPHAPATASRPVSGAASRAAASRPAPKPRKGVRGKVVSTRAPLPDGGPGVDPGAWEARVFALVESRTRRAVDRIGIACERAPLGPGGGFEIDLPTGPVLVVVRHEARRPAPAPVVEAWYAYAEVRDSDEGLVDLGEHVFDPATIEGVVRVESGAPAAGAGVDFSDEAKEPGDPLPRGIYLRTTASERGEFAFSVTRADGGAVAGRLAARLGESEARRDRVRPGDTVDLLLATPGTRAEVTLEAPWSPGIRMWVCAEDGRIAFSCAGGKESAGTIEERRVLPVGRYAVEVLRPAGAGPGEWARTEFEVTDTTARRIRIEPAWRPARTITGFARPGSTVAWVTRCGGGERAPVVRDRVLAGDDGRFELRCVPTTESLLSSGSLLIPVPPGCGPVTDVGDLQSG